MRDGDREKDAIGRLKQFKTDGRHGIVQDNHSTNNLQEELKTMQENEERPYKRETHPIKAIHAYCLACQGGEEQAVKDCQATRTSTLPCLLHEARSGKVPDCSTQRGKELIKEHCLLCDPDADPQTCQEEDCQLWLHRLGKTPPRKRKLTVKEYIELLRLAGLISHRKGSRSEGKKKHEAEPMNGVALENG
ncbi:hypothetical protein JCM14635_21800 [Megalodesulfovibrio paquesii]